VSAPSLKILEASQLKDKVCVVVGTRPGIVMLSPIVRELQRRGVPHFLLHTGQHYSHNMDRQLTDELELPEPAHKLGGTADATMHGAQTAVMLRGCEEVLLQERPKLVLVGGDANTNLAGALAARKLHIRVGHVEAGERSYDWRMPEEHNRVIIDHISEYLFTTNEKGREHLEADNVRGQIVVTGNPIVDATRENLEIARRVSRLPASLGLARDGYLVLTVHREENVDDRAALAGILDGLRLLADRLGRPIVFPAHPRTRKRLHEFGLAEAAASVPGLIVSEAVGYLDFLSLVDSAALVLTDSGGVQQESCVLGVPAVTLRDSTEWTETVRIGANVLAGVRPEAIVAAATAMLGRVADWEDLFGDGRAARRIVDTAEAALAAGDLHDVLAAPPATLLEDSR
jgi:UDP-N-acetylglucosamine 2-epimerase (non-hydrolysing)